MTAAQRRDLVRYLLELGRTKGLEHLSHDIAKFSAPREPLRPNDWPNWTQHVNRDRVYDYYTREAMHFRQQKPTPLLLPDWPAMDGGNPFTIALARQFQFQKIVPILCGPASLRFHDLRFAEGDGECGCQWGRFGQVSELPQGLFLFPARQIPERAIESIAGGATGHVLEQHRMGEIGLYGRKTGDFFGAAFGTFTFIINRRCFGPTLVAAIRNFTQHDIDVGFGASADNEGTSDRPSFDGDRNRQSHAALLLRIAERVTQLVNGRGGGGKAPGFAALVVCLAIGCHAASAERRAIYVSRPICSATSI